MVRKYQQRCGLGDVHLTVEIVSPDVLISDWEDSGMMGDCTRQREHKMARIRLLDPAKDPKPSNRIAYDPEESAVHELQHLVLDPLKDLWLKATDLLGIETRSALRDLWNSAEERVCNQIMFAILDREPKWEDNHPLKD